MKTLSNHDAADLMKLLTKWRRTAGGSPDSGPKQRAAGVVSDLLDAYPFIFDPHNAPDNAEG